MAALPQVSYDHSSSDVTSTIDRVRVRMTRLMHPSRDRPVAPVVHPALVEITPQPAALTAAALAPLVADVSALERVLEDSEKLIREAWNVAGDLNQVRRQQCTRGEDVALLAEALGTFQGLLNRGRHNLRTAAKAVNDLKAGLAMR